MSIYLRDLNFVSSRLLSLINMEQTSRTNGSFDRTFGVGNLQIFRHQECKKVFLH